MSELRVGASVRGRDGDFGKLDALVVDPSTKRVTSLVVSHDRLAPRVMVPEDQVTAADPDVVTVGLSVEELHELPRFDLPDYIEPDESWSYGDLALDPGSYFLEPFATPLDGWVLTTHERVARGEISMRRGAVVFSSDGTKVGHVDEFLVDPDDGHITHVVIREGAIKHRDVVVPVGRATTIEDDRVVLDIDLHAVESLEHIPVTRHGHVRRD